MNIVTKSLSWIFLSFQIASAQTCPVPQMYGNTSLAVGIPNDNLPQSNVNIWADNAGSLLVVDGTGLPGSHVVTATLGSDSSNQIYLVDLKMKPDGKFSKKPVVIANRTTSAAGDDIFTVSRLGASTSAGNFVLSLRLNYDGNGLFLPPSIIECRGGMSVKSFNARYLNTGIERPKFAVRYFGDLIASEFHNSLY